MLLLNRKAFVAALRRAIRVLPRKTTIPALQNSKITAYNEGISIQSTNLEQSLVEAVPGEGNGTTQGMSICIATQQLLGTINALPQHIKEIPVDTQPGYLIVGTTTFTPACTTDKYPVIPRIPANAQAVIDLPDDLDQHLQFVRVATSKDIVKYALQGIYFDFHQGNLASSDGHRLHCTNLWKPNPKVKPVIVPPAVFDLDTPTQMIIPQAEGKGAVANVFFRTSNGYMVTRTMDGHFPDYKGVLWKGASVSATTSREDLISVLRPALPLLSEKKEVCRIRFNDGLEIHARHDTSGVAYLNEAPASIEGTETSVNLNPYKLLDILKYINGEYVTLSLKTPEQPIHIRSAIDSSQWALLMPLTIEVPSGQTASRK